MCQEGELEGSFEQGSTPGDDHDDDDYGDGDGDYGDDDFDNDDGDAQVVINHDGDDLSEQGKLITTTIIIIIIIRSILIAIIITFGIILLIIIIMIMIMIAGEHSFGLLGAGHRIDSLAFLCNAGKTGDFIIDHTHYAHDDDCDNDQL